MLRMDRGGWQFYLWALGRFLGKGGSKAGTGLRNGVRRYVEDEWGKVWVLSRVLGNVKGCLWLSTTHLL
jgi:hypothetical protein